MARYLLLALGSGFSDGSNDGNTLPRDTLKIILITLESCCFLNLNNPLNFTADS